ncbi:competence type IV pilus assembly protein ComGB [Virgibacillus sp. YIM 98842]|uniref:competence type IV pilus assembly protein ComGB n=1 Tax=Virgibacillus sp. YIM 98842 TaxID=2663533 RepID=UPI0013DCA0F2|nr:competence type IV pilus assembly protein ComGB [Virgibacillus sp. YIM 98842]
MDIFPKKFIKRRKINLSENLQILFLRRMSRLLASGYPLLEALQVLKWDKHLAPPAASISRALKNGNSIDASFLQANFHHTIVGYLSFVKSNGDLEGSIKKCLFMFENRIKYRNKFLQTVRYPLTLLFIFIVLLYVIQLFVLPSFADLFQTTAHAPASLVFSILIIDLLFNAGLTVILSLLIGFLGWRIMKNKLSIETQIKIIQSLPVYRKMVKLQTSFHFSTHFSTLLKTGMPYKDILDHMSEQRQLPVLSHYSVLIKQELIKGIAIASLLSRFSLLEKQLTGIFQNTQNSEALAKDLSIYAELLTEEIERKTMKTIAYIQPVFFAILAGFIMFIYITLMWPMFQLLQTI